MVRSTFRIWVRRLLALEDTPERIALAFAIGVFLAFSPLLGLHTLLGIGIAFLFGLNRVAVLLGVLINNPWTLVPIYTAATYLGGLLVGFPVMTALPEFGWKEMWQGSTWIGLARQWRVLTPLLLGSTILSILFAILSYPLALYLLRQGRAYRSRNTVL